FVASVINIAQIRPSVWAQPDFRQLARSPHVSTWRLWLQFCGRSVRGAVRRAAIFQNRRWKRLSHVGYRRATCKRSVMGDSQPFIEDSDGGTLAQAIVDTVREPLLVLDKNLRVLAASRSFYRTVKVAPSAAQATLIFALVDGQWDIPELRLLLERIVPEHGVMDDYEVERLFPDLGTRTMLLNARKVFYEGNSHTTLVLGIEDVTARRVLERERENLLQKQQALLREKDML